LTPRVIALRCKAIVNPGLAKKLPTISLMTLEAAFFDTLHFSDKIKIVVNKNKHEFLLEYDDLGFLTTDRAGLLCNKNIVDIVSFVKTSKNNFEAIIDSLVCF